ncbi:YfiR family protein [Deferrisoma camini]|uniref:YfiR family protein n=1 Tax=Deferrisoma camini TaxID=1035120 RepID=UPI00046CF3A0|nr:YfiR family protein [Deferrisoma camini]
MSRRRFLSWAVAALVGGWSRPAAPAGGARTGREQEVKLAYLYNLARFARWPRDDPPTAGTFRFGIWGDDPFGPLWNELIGRVVHGRPVEVVRVRTARDARACRVVFLAGATVPAVGRMLEALDGWPVLTVSDQPGFVDRGGMVGFVRRGEKIRFEVNLGRVRAAGLRISAEVLRLALRVVGQEGAGRGSLP